MKTAEMTNIENENFVVFSKTEIDVLIFAGQRLLNMYEQSGTIDHELSSAVDKLRDCKAILDTYKEGVVVPELKLSFVKKDDISTKR